MMRSLLGGVYFSAVAAASSFTYNEEYAAQDIWLNQGLDCKTGIANWTCGLPCDRTHVSNVHIAENKLLSTYALVGEYEGGCLLLVRGSKDVMNYLVDFEFALTNPYGPDCPDCKVHSGFYEAWKSIRGQVQTHLEKLECSSKKLTITGHSLGAAMSVLAAFDLVGNYSLNRVYTYGQPRVGTTPWADAFSSRLQKVPYFRVVDYKDAVPHLPMKNLFGMDFIHPGPEVYYNATRKGSFRVCTSSQDEHCSFQWNIAETLPHTCDHCSYLGMNPCNCGSTTPQCVEPKSLREVVV
jgi:hypothetical protein